ncbi:MAG: hypothetical protein JOZ53_18155 [Planctomycetaceae bacterium]|nr:hypothetical protein [Planctomycetaceae bacterium]
MVEQGRAVGILPPSESSLTEDRGEDVALVEQLQQAGCWSIGNVVLRGEGGGLVWIVLGRRGSVLLTVSGTTRPEVWRQARDQVPAVGLLPGGRGR